MDKIFNEALNNWGQGQAIARAVDHAAEAELNRRDDAAAKADEYRERVEHRRAEVRADILTGAADGVMEQEAEDLVDAMCAAVIALLRDDPRPGEIDPLINKVRVVLRGIEDRVLDEMADKLAEEEEEARGESLAEQAEDDARDRDADRDKA